VLRVKRGHGFMQTKLIGQEGWFPAKYEAYGHMLYRIAMVHLGKRADAEEAVQEAFIKLLYKAPEFREQEHEKAWLIRVITNQCRNMTRSVWNRRVIKLDEIGQIGYSTPDLELLDSVLRLPFKYKSVIHLYYYEGYVVKEIADILGMRESAVKMRLKRGRELLKLEWEGEDA
jgi:RNA polymerase sigma factor (sigma-70 family)